MMANTQKAAAQQEIFSLAGMFDGFTVNRSKPDIHPSSGDGISIPIHLGNDGRILECWWAGVSHPVRGVGEDLSDVTTRAEQGFSIITTRGKELSRQNRVSPLPVGLYATVRTREACLPAAITSLNECRLTVITVQDEPHLNVISSSNEGLSNISDGLNKGFSDISTASNEDLSVITTREKELAILKAVSGVFGTVLARNEGFSDITTRGHKDFMVVTTRDSKGLITVTTRDKTNSVPRQFDNSGKKQVRRYFGTSTHKAGIEFLQSIKKRLIEFSEPIKKEPTEFCDQYAHTRARDYTEFSGTLEQMFCNSIKKECARRLESEKKDLPLFRLTVYGNSAPAKSGAGIGVSNTYKATHDAPSVFFCVLASAHLFFSDMVIIRVAHKIMVGWMGAEKSAPVSLYAGYANPIQLTTNEIGVSGGGIYTQYKEAAIWLLPPPKNRLLSGAFTHASNHAISLLPLALNPKPDPCYLIAHACLLPAFVQGVAMLKSYDLPTNPAIYTKHLIALAQLTGDVLANDSAPDTDFLLALAFSIETVARDLHTMLESNELPGVTA